MLSLGEQGPKAEHAGDSESGVAGQEVAGGARARWAAAADPEPRARPKGLANPFLLHQRYAMNQTVP